MGSLATNMAYKPTQPDNLTQALAAVATQRDRETEASAAMIERAIALIDAVANGILPHTQQFGWVVARAHPLVLVVRRESLSVVIAPAVVWQRRPAVFKPCIGKLQVGAARLVLLGQLSDIALQIAMQSGLQALLPEGTRLQAVFVAIDSAFALMQGRVHNQRQKKELSRYRYELGELVEIARMLSTEQETEKLLNLILEKARYISGADGGSIYVVQGGRDGEPRTLRFKLTQNDSVSFDWREFTLPINVHSIAGATALDSKSINLPDVTALSADLPYKVDKSFDEKIGYRTRSMLCVPLVSKNRRVIGVLQLINKKLVPQTKLRTEEDFATQVLPFDSRSQALLEALAAQAGICLENAMLYEEIQNILDGFVHASVEAIEQRDPSTSGHSRRVAELSIGLASALMRVQTGAYAGISFTDRDMQELKYAALLHDFGKIGVRERVLVKAKKLYPNDLQRLQDRFDFARLSYKTRLLQRQLELQQSGAVSSDLERAMHEYEEQISSLTEAWNTICLANEPSVLANDVCCRVDCLQNLTYLGADGESLPLVTPSELANLRIPKGSLNDMEFDEIRSHVEHTYQFLVRIPWGARFANIPTIAGAHHERLDGTGYPKGLGEAQIPVQSKIMSIADIFDALTASDRPYKKAVPIERALAILHSEAQNNHIDKDLLRAFVEAEVWNRRTG